MFPKSLSSEAELGLKPGNGMQDLRSLQISQLGGSARGRVLDCGQGSQPLPSHRLVGDHQLHHRKGVEDSNGGDVPEEQKGAVRWAGLRSTSPPTRSWLVLLTRSRSGTSFVEHAYPSAPGQPHRGIAEEKQE